MPGINTTASVYISKSEMDRFETYIKDTLRAKLFETLGKIEVKLRQRIKIYLHEKMRESPTYQSLVYGDLRHELGVVDPKGKMDAIIDVWAENIFFHPNINKHCVGTVSIGLFRSDYQDVLNLIESHYLSVSRVGKITIVEWLRWLLLEGTKPIILHHAYVDKVSKYSRTGRGLMLRRDNYGNHYAIPPADAGVQGDNFAVRAVATDFVLFLEKFLKYHFSREFI